MHDREAHGDNGEVGHSFWQANLLDWVAPFRDSCELGFEVWRQNVEQPSFMPPVFEVAWYDLEGDQTKKWRSSRGDAEVVLASAESKPRLVHVTFRLGSIPPYRVDICFGNRKVYSAQVAGPEEGAAPIDLPVTLPAGPSPLQFRSERRAQIANRTDPRRLAFRLIDFRIGD